jgi:hypothetical protein
MYVAFRNKATPLTVNSQVTRKHAVVTFPIGHLPTGAI